MINTIYEIEDYDESVGQVRLRLLKDPNGILISTTNTYGIVKKMIRATLLDLHYQIVPQKEEYEIREQLQTDKKIQCKNCDKDFESAQVVNMQKNKVHGKQAE